jgi:hypothetical protein
MQILATLIGTVPAPGRLTSVSKSFDEKAASMSATGSPAASNSPRRRALTGPIS